MNSSPPRRASRSARAARRQRPQSRPAAARRDPVSQGVVDVLERSRSMNRTPTRLPPRFAWAIGLGETLVQQQPVGQAGQRVPGSPCGAGAPRLDAGRDVCTNERIDTMLRGRRAGTSGYPLARRSSRRPCGDWASALDAAPSPLISARATRPVVGDPASWISGWRRSASEHSSAPAEQALACGDHRTRPRVPIPPAPQRRVVMVRRQHPLARRRPPR